MRARLLGILGLLAGFALIAAGGAAAAKGGFSPVAPESPNADRIETTYWVIFGFAAAIFLLVEIALVVFILRYRSRGRSREDEGPQIRGHTRLELAWTAVPVLILAAIAAFTFYELPGIKNVPEASAGPGGTLNITVEGRQFYWQFTYPNGLVSIDRMRVPAGRTIRLDVTAPKFDVIHSWWIPALGGKLDAIPGNTNPTWFRATKVGTYNGRCTEFCGLFHAEMDASVQVMPPAEFDRWFAGNTRGQVEGTSDLGKQLFEGVCAKCHGFQGRGGYGPALKGSPLLTDKEGLTTLLQNGGKLMPAVGKGWSARQTDALFTYLGETIAKGGSGG